MYRVKRGEIYYIDLGVDENGSVQSGKRPVVIVQNDIGNKYSPTTLICPITSKQKKKMPTHVEITPKESGLPKQSTIMCEQLFTVNKNDLEEMVGKLNDEKFKELNKGLTVSIGLN